MTNLPQRTLGSTGPTVSALGLGLMGMSDLYGPADEHESIATIHAALDAGVTLLDTGDFYGMGHNELLLREALRGRNRDNAVISVKFGALRGPDGSWIGVDTRPAAIKNFLAYTPAPPRHRPHRHLPAGPDRPQRPDRGDRRRARRDGRRPATSGTSASPRWAPTPCAGPHAVHPITDLQIEYSLISRGIEDEILPDGARARHRHHRIRRALPRAASPATGAPDRAARDFRGHLPRFSGENLERNLALVEALRAVARGAGRQRGPGRDRLGALPRRGHRAAGRRPPP